MNNTTKNLYIVMLIVALCAVGGYVYATRYVSGLTQKTSDTKEEIDNLEAKYNHLQALHKAAANTSDEKGKISSYIVRPGGSVDFITNIEQVAAASRLSYNTDRIEAKDVPELGDSQKELLEVAFSASGNWSDLVRFVKLVELMPYGMKIQRVEFTSLGKAPVAVSKVTASDIGNGGAAGVATSTMVIDKSSGRENRWNASILFDVVKNKDN